MTRGVFGYELVLDPADHYVRWDNHTDLPVMPEDRVLILIDAKRDGAVQGSVEYRGGVRCSGEKPAARLRAAAPVRAGSSGERCLPAPAASRYRNCCSDMATDMSPSIWSLPDMKAEVGLSSPESMSSKSESDSL